MHKLAHFKALVTFFGQISVLKFTCFHYLHSFRYCLSFFSFIQSFIQFLQRFIHSRNYSFKKKSDYSFKQIIHSIKNLIIHSMKILIFLKNAVSYRQPLVPEVRNISRSQKKSEFPSKTAPILFPTFNRGFL